MIVIEVILTMASVIALLWIGIFIGREFGTFEKFILWFLKRIGG
jgi:hypothetical protein